MHRHRLATFLLGFWLAGLLAITFVATRNFLEVDQLLTNPSEGASRLLSELPRADARLLLRHQASELNRLFFASFELMEIGVGVLLVAALWPLRSLKVGWRALTIILLAITVGMHVLLTPEITHTGRALDFADPAAQTAARAHFWQLHSTYSGFVLFKLALALALTGRLLIQRSRRERLIESRKQVDRIDHAHHREVNR